MSIHDPIKTVSDDHLRREFLAESIWNRLAADDYPSVLGLYGSWGTGKTSLLNLLMELNLTKSKDRGYHDLCIVMIDAWMYEATSNLLVPIIVRLKKLFKDENFLPNTWNASARRVLSTTALSVANVALSALTLKSANLNDIRSFYKEAEEQDRRDASSILLDWEKLTDEIDETTNAFSEMVEAVINELLS